MACSVSAPCPYSRDLNGRELTRLLVVIPKVVIHIAAVGTTSNDIFSKRKTLDEGSL